MGYPEFKLESYLAKREFTARYNFCASDLESEPMSELLNRAGEKERALWETLSLGYTETKGLPLLREQVSQLYGDSISSEEVLCFCGAEEGIYSVMHALLAPSDHVIVVTPCYQSLLSLPRGVCAVTTVALRHESGWSLDLGEVEKAMTPHTKLIVINFPHNPTGALLTRQQQLDLVNLARRHGIWIFSDEVYRFLEVDPESRLPPMADLYERGLSLSVMSKAYGLAGLRVGWVATGSREMLEEVAKVKHYLSICNSAPSEVLSLIALQTREVIHERNSRLMAKNLALLDDFFEEHAEWFEWVRPQGGCIGYPLLKADFSVEAFADDLFHDSGVLILPGSIYDDQNNHFRLGFGRLDMPASLDQFTRYVMEKKKDWKPS